VIASARLNLQPMCATASRLLRKPRQGRVLIQITRHSDSSCYTRLVAVLDASV